MTFYPYRSQEARDNCLAYLDRLAAREWPVTSEERTVETRYGSTFVRVTGPASAPALVLLHGAGTTSLMWAPNVEALSAACRTVAVDQIGEFGRSVCTMPVPRFEDLSLWMDDLLDGLALAGPANLMGISYGGAIAAEYALRCPRRVNKLVLLAPASTVLRLSPRFASRLVLAAILRQRYLPTLLRGIFPDMAQRDPAWIQSTLDLLRTNFRNLQRRRPLLPRVWSDSDWERLQVQTLFLVGEHEVIYSATRAVQRLRRVAPNVAAEIVPGAGHDLTFVQPGLVNQRVVRFLNAARSPV